ncbi:MAG: hypothetical protein A2287_06295 [Candidatus Melainabacteria bacterium RIFOXYA12_FULL_32_12]|nr:MAG: hypothetical protein A2104_07625 [Candidatus Melainabacteria bacterium GWF2_32_7]OGI20610.1 MAG: hypothetical protein A2255_01895 [Candidatus Melainabacteria bacterium RIFOXYA2_FULL_32_9]OGI31031.1 MAG: hypothetical protein A2287_06295 [Candidatus Melainabacteria bacterium RIFOXYA12_FULL_32_12]
MATTLISKYNTKFNSFGAKFKPSQLKPYREVLKMVYDNPQFKAIYENESRETVLKILAYLETIREKSYELIKETILDVQIRTDMDDTEIRDFTKQFINNNLEAVRKLSYLPIELQPSKESMKTLAKLSFKSVISQN